MSRRSSIPTPLKRLAQWVVWEPKKKVLKDGTRKVDKVPLDPNHPERPVKAKTNDPKSWGTFDQAVAALKSHPTSAGVGFVFSACDPYVGIDLDGCRNKGTGKIEPWAKEIIRTLSSYTEVSPSGTGIHIIVRADVPQGARSRRANIPVEIYQSKRFFTMTGNHLKGTPATVEERTAELAIVYEKVFGLRQDHPSAASNPSTPAQASSDLGDDELVNRAMKAGNGAAFSRLWQGDTSAYGHDHSAADQAICNMLAFWSGKDAQRIDALFRRSKLFRKKWDKVHSGDGRTYGQMTIDKAVKSTTEVYETAGSRRAQTSKGRTSMKNDKDGKKPQRRPELQRFFDGNTFIPKYLGDVILQHFRFRYALENLWVYRGGVYHDDGEAVVESEARTLLAEEFRTRRISETYHYIRIGSRSDPPQPDGRHINLQNGRLDWITGELKPHTSEVFQVTQLPVRYQPEAECPHFDRFLRTTFEGNLDVIPLVEEMIGYCLIADTRFEKAFMLTGQGSNGKGVLLDTIEALLGPDNVSNVSLQDLQENRFRVAELVGKLANIFADLDSRALKGSDMFKTLVTGDAVTAERKYTDAFKFRSYARLIFSANELPPSRDRSSAYFRRWVIIPFTRTFDESEADKTLRSKLAATQELSGILNRAIGGLRRLFRNGRFSSARSVRLALDEYRKENDSVAAFIDACCDISDPEASVEKAEFYRAYREWCEDQGLHPAPNNKIKAAILRTVPEAEEFRPPRELTGRRPPWRWKGLRPMDGAF